MSRILEINLQDILSMAQSPSTRRASRLLDRHAADHAILDNLLRDYREDPVNDEETRQRDDIDNLINIYSLLEVACIARFVPDPLPADLRNRAAKHLGIPAVQRFYTEFHPQSLPRSFYRRVRGEVAPTETDGPDLPAQFLRFLDTTREFEDDDDVEILLTFLDDYVIDEYSWEDVAKIVESPKRFVRALSQRQKKDDIVAAAVVGYWKFVTFCNGFHDLLRDLDDKRLLQSAVWHYYAYWFDRLEDKVGVVLKKSLSSIEAMVRATSSNELSLFSLQSIQAQREGLDDLLSGRYRAELDNSLESTLAFASR